MNSGRRLIVVVGPTGSGKTDLALCLAERYRAPILSADSRQIYRGMAIGTAQPTPEQLRRAEHHFIASADVWEDFSCGEFEKQALQCLEELFPIHDTVVVAGGSGLYVKALCEGMDDLPDADPALREELSRQVAGEGLGPLLEELERLDAEYYRVVDRNNPARVIRAVEVCRMSGRPFSAMRTGEKRRRNFDVVKIGTQLDRAVLYDRINRRVDAMVAAGLEAEVRALLPYRNCNALRSVGYTEMFDYFDGKISFDEAVELIKRNTRRYAKRQLTWFRRDGEIRWFDPSHVEEIAGYVDSRFGE